MILLIIALCCAVTCASELSYWNSVQINGGGYVIGLVPHPHVKDLVYARTDVGGAYRSNGTVGWNPITENMKKSNDFGGDAVAIDPQDPDVAYYFGGMYSYNDGCLYKSQDQGQTWTCILKERGQSNGANRFFGERIFVDLVNSSRVLFGSRFAGLYESANGGKTWTVYNTSEIPVDKHGDTGVNCICADPTSATDTPFKFTKTLYALNYNDSVYRTSNGGKNWERIGGPKIAARAVVSPDGKYLYATGNLHNYSMPGVSRFNTLTNKWDDITPAALQPGVFIYCSIAVHPSISNMLIVGTRSTVHYDNPLYKSMDYGQTWTNFSRNFQYEPAVPWLSKFVYFEAQASFNIDPFDVNHAWETDFFGVWQTFDLNAPNPTWTTMVHGIEEVVMLCMITPPGGNLQSGCADDSGFNHINVDQVPLVKRDGGDTTGLDYAALKPSLIVAAWTLRYSYKGGSMLSYDGGATWKTLANVPDAVGGKITVTADGSTIVWCPINYPTRISHDHGVTWKAIGGDLKSNVIEASGDTDIWHSYEPVHADRVNASKVYIATQGVFYRSDDGGATFRNVSSVSHAPGYGHWGVRASGVEGHVWYYANNVLVRSVDGGDTWSIVQNVTSVSALHFGIGRNSKITNTLYIIGTYKDQFGVWRSEDFGKTFVQYSSIGLPVPLINTISSDGSIFGKIYVGTNGRGIKYSAPDIPITA